MPALSGRESRQEIAERVFDVLDESGTGALDFSTFKTQLELAGVHSDEYWRSTLDGFDSVRRGSNLSREEFVGCVLSQRAGAPSLDAYIASLNSLLSNVRRAATLAQQLEDQKRKRTGGAKPSVPKKRADTISEQKYGVLLNLEPKGSAGLDPRAPQAQRTGKPLAAPTICFHCEHHFGIKRARHACDGCGQSVCYLCSPHRTDQHPRLCVCCWEKRVAKGRGISAGAIQGFIIQYRNRDNGYSRRRKEARQKVIGAQASLDRGRGDMASLKRWRRELDALRAETGFVAVVLVRDRRKINRWVRRLLVCTDGGLLALVHRNGKDVYYVRSVDEIAAVTQCRVDGQLELPSLEPTASTSSTASKIMSSFKNLKNLMYTSKENKGATEIENLTVKTLRIEWASSAGGGGRSARRKYKPTEFLVLPTYETGERKSGLAQTIEDAEAISTTEAEVAEMRWSTHYHEGRPYYYDNVTRTSQWEKPEALMVDQTRRRSRQRVLSLLHSATFQRGAAMLGAAAAGGVANGIADGITGSVSGAETVASRTAASQSLSSSLASFGRQDSDAAVQLTDERTMDRDEVKESIKARRLRYMNNMKTVLMAQRAIKARMGVPVDWKTREHSDKLRFLWSKLKPNEAFPGQKSGEWGDLGFQGKDPQTDFRGSGALGLDSLCYWSEKYQEYALTLLATRPAAVEKQYPVCTAGIALCAYLAGYLGIKAVSSLEKKKEMFADLPLVRAMCRSLSPPGDAALAGKDAGRGAEGDRKVQAAERTSYITTPVPVPSNISRGTYDVDGAMVMVMEIYCALMKNFDFTWRKENATYMQFGAIIKKVQEKLDSLLANDPLNIKAILDALQAVA